MNFDEITMDRAFDELIAGKQLKYIFQNNNYNRNEVYEMLKNRQLKLDLRQIYYVEINKFKRLTNGQYLKIEIKRQ